MPTSIPSRIIAAKMRMSIAAEIGKSGRCLLGGTAESSRPTPVVFRGGPPLREEDVCVSGSCSHSLNSWGISKIVLQAESVVEDANFSVGAVSA
jgi:hypothetical protein